MTLRLKPDGKTSMEVREEKERPKRESPLSGRPGHEASLWSERRSRDVPGSERRPAGSAPGEESNPRGWV